MRVAMISCHAYRDCWNPFFKLFERFWPDCPYPKIALSNDAAGRSLIPEEWEFFSMQARDWCELATGFARAYDNEPFLLMQEDFLLNAPVRGEMVWLGLDEMRRHGAGAVRLYPCPGANEDYGHPLFGSVTRGSDYRISCQASIFDPAYFSAIAQTLAYPWDFELEGSRISDGTPGEVLAWKREIEPWPIQYLCSAIGRGTWSQDAHRLCDKYGIEVDWSQRETEAA